VVQLGEDTRSGEWRSSKCALHHVPYRLDAAQSKYIPERGSGLVGPKLLSSISGEMDWSAKKKR